MQLMCESGQRVRLATWVYAKVVCDDFTKTWGEFSRSGREEEVMDFVYFYR